MWPTVRYVDFSLSLFFHGGPTHLQSWQCSCPQSRVLISDGWLCHWDQYLFAYLLIYSLISLVVVASKPLTLYTQGWCLCRHWATSLLPDDSSSGFFFFIVLSILSLSPLTPLCICLRDFPLSPTPTMMLGWQTCTHHTHLFPWMLRIQVLMLVQQAFWTAEPPPSTDSCLDLTTSYVGK